MTEETQKTDDAAKGKKMVEVKILRKCSNKKGELFAEGDITKLSRDLALRFIENGVAQAVV